MQPALVLASTEARVDVPEHFYPRWVKVRAGYMPGQIIIAQKHYFLYLITEPQRAIRYGVGLGREGLAFVGTAEVGRKAKWPSWRPTDEMIEREPKKYLKYRDGMPGGPDNPLGARALYLYRDGRDTLFRIHGTTEPRTIGSSVSNGCIRMVNSHIADLYDRVELGTTVTVI